MMPYQVIIRQTDFAGTFNQAIEGEIWVPPPPGGSSPGTPNFAGTVNSGADQALTLTFPTLAAAPSGASAMLVNWAEGDLFRSGPLGQLPTSPAPLALIIVPGQPQGGVAITPEQLSNMVGSFSGMTFNVPSAVQVAFGVATLGAFIPQSITISTASVMLDTGAMSLGIVGTINVKLVGLVTVGFSFTFSMSLSMGPSGDPASISRVLAATVVNPAPLLIISGVVLLPGAYYALQAIAGWVASTVASMLESQANQSIASLVASTLEKDFGERLTQSAVISADLVIINSSGIVLNLSIGDIFGPGVVPIQVNTTKVPEVIGLDPATAMRNLQAAHLQMAIKDYEYSYNVDSPIIAAQEPSPGTPLQEDSYVYVVVRAPKKGPQP
jgi:hypothetical protein